jgi:DNA-binding CsgD family transcriptional regulator
VWLGSSCRWPTNGTSGRGRGLHVGRATRRSDPARCGRGPPRALLHPSAQHQAAQLGDMSAQDLRLPFVPGVAALGVLRLRAAPITHRASDAALSPGTGGSVMRAHLQPPPRGRGFRGARPNAARAAAPIPRRNCAQNGQPSLMERETQILRWVSCGKTNREIAGILGVSPHTVRKHLEHAYDKLGVHTRAAAIARLN